MQRVMEQRTTRGSRVRTSEGSKAKQSKSFGLPLVGSLVRPGVRQGTTRVRSEKRAELGIGLVEATQQTQAPAVVMTELPAAATGLLVPLGCRAMQHM